MRWAKEHAAARYNLANSGLLGWSTEDLILEPGDLLVAYTDGIVEPENVYGEQFGEEHLKELMIKYSKADSAELIARTMEAVVQWTGAGELQDDMTMLVARRI